jgi:small subunit ribosomal protein S16
LKTDSGFDWNFNKSATWYWEKLVAVRIRMKKLGRKHRPFFRICVMDSRKPRDGKAIEEVGTYDPMIREKSDRVRLKMDRIDYWMSVGATPSDKVATLIKKVKTNTFGSVNSPPPMTAPKEPEPETVAEETPTETSTNSAEQPPAE